MRFGISDLHPVEVVNLINGGFHSRHLLSALAAVENVTDERARDGLDVRAFSDRGGRFGTDSNTGLNPDYLTPVLGNELCTGPCSLNPLNWHQGLHSRDAYALKSCQALRTGKSAMQEELDCPLVIGSKAVTCPPAPPPPARLLKSSRRPLARFRPLERFKHQET